MSDHQKRYEDVERLYVRSRGVAMDRNWRAFLWLTTVRTNIWHKVEPFVNLDRAEVDFDSMSVSAWSSGERQLIRLAHSLYSDHGDVDIGAMASSFDDELWTAVIEALELYRGRKSPSKA